MNFAFSVGADFSFPGPPATQEAVDLRITVAATTIAALAAIANAVNTTGKGLRSWRYDENGRLYRPLGITAGAAWRPLDDQSGQSDITPA
jgi:hypothetical protein